MCKIEVASFPANLAKIGPTVKTANLINLITTILNEEALKLTRQINKDTAKNVGGVTAATILSTVPMYSAKANDKKTMVTKSK